MSTDINDIMKRIERTPETELELIFRHIMHKIDAFAKLLKLDENSKRYFKTILINAIMLYYMLEEKHGSLKESENLEECVKTVKRIESANLQKVEETLFLARDISQEYLLASSIEMH